MDLKYLLCSLEERLVEHDNNRKEVQDKLQDICTKVIEEANLLEEKLNEELQNSFSAKEEKILNHIEKLNNKGEEGEEEKRDNEFLTRQVQEELSQNQRYQIKRLREAEKLVDSYEVNIVPIKIESVGISTNEIEEVTKLLQEHLDKNIDYVNATQKEIGRICSGLRSKMDALEKNVNKELEYLFSQKDACLQSTVILLREIINDENKNEIKEPELEEIKAKAKAVLVTSQKYVFVENTKQKRKYSCDSYVLKCEKVFHPEYLDLEAKKPSFFVKSFINKYKLSFSFSLLSKEEKMLWNLAFHPSK